MFAKVFNQIFDSSIVEMPETRFTFMDLLVLADVNGVVDMTHEAIARRTNRPIDLIRKTIAELEQPDDRSRTKTLNGARIRRLDKHRDWGWEIVNYRYFREVASEQQRREKTRVRTRRYRKALEIKPCDAAVTHSDARQTPVTHSDDSPYASASAFPSGFTEEWEFFIEHRKKKGAPMTDHAKDLFLAKLATRPSEAIEAIQMAIMRNWTGFNWEWFDNDKNDKRNARDQRHSAESSRSLGTANEGVSSQYRGIGKLQSKLPNGAGPGA